MRTEHDVGRHQPKSPPLSWSRFCDSRGRAARQALIFESAGRPGKSRDCAHFAVENEHHNWSAQAYRRWRYRRGFSILIWQIASPKWQFEGSTFDQSAAAFDNPDHVAIVIHNDRRRLGLAEGEPKYDELEAVLARFPIISVPTITLQGDAAGALRPDPTFYA